MWPNRKSKEKYWAVLYKFIPRAARAVQQSNPLNTSVIDTYMDAMAVEQLYGTDPHHLAPPLNHLGSVLVTMMTAGQFHDTIPPHQLLLVDFQRKKENRSLDGQVNKTHPFFAVFFISVYESFACNQLLSDTVGGKWPECSPYLF